MRRGIELGCAEWAGSERKMGKMMIREDREWTAVKWKISQSSRREADCCVLGLWKDLLWPLLTRGVFLGFQGPGSALAH